METEKTFSRGIRWTSKSAFVSLATQLGQLAVISKLLQPHDLGVFAVVTIIYSLMLIFSDLGMSNLLVQTKNLSSALINTSLLACSVFGVIMAALLLIVGSLISTYFGMVELELLMPLLAMIALVNPYIQIHSALLQREGRFQFLAHLDTWAAIIAFAVVWLGAVFHPGPECLVLGLISATCFRFLRLSTRTNKLHALSSKFSASSIAPHLRFFTFQLLDRLVSFSSGSVDKLIIGRALGGEALGRYSLASQLAMKPYSILGPVLSRVSLPTLAHGGQTDEEIAKLYLVVVRLAFLLAFPTYIFMYIVGPIAITQLIGVKWAIVAQLLPIPTCFGTKLLFVEPSPNCP